VDSLQALMNTPVSNGTASPQVLANLAAVTPEMKPAVVNHYNVTPAVDVYASVDGRDLGAVAKDISETVQPFRGHLPRGTDLEIRGQVHTMQSSFAGLLFGLVMSVILVYLLIVVNFQSRSEEHTSELQSQSK